MASSVRILGARSSNLGNIRLQTRNLFAQKCSKQPADQTKKAGPTIPEGYKLLKEKQAKFQINDGLPVWLKGGPKDRLLYGSTVGLLLFGVGCSLKFIIESMLK